MPSPTAFVDTVSNPKQVCQLGANLACDALGLFNGLPSINAGTQKGQSPLRVEFLDNVFG